MLGDSYNTFASAQSMTSAEAGALTFCTDVVNLIGPVTYGPNMRSLVCFQPSTTLTPVLSATSVTVDHTAESFTTGAAHGLATGCKVVLGGTAVPTGLTFGTVYYAIVQSSTVFKLAATLAEALAGTVTAFTGNGTSVTATAIPEVEFFVGFSELETPSLDAVMFAGASGPVQAARTRLVPDANVSAANDTITLNQHGFYTGEPIYFPSASTFPTLDGVIATAAKTYYAVPTAAGVLKVATSLRNAQLGITADITAGFSNIAIASRRDRLSSTGPSTYVPVGRQEEFWMGPRGVGTGLGSFLAAAWKSTCKLSAGALNAQLVLNADESTKPYLTGSTV